MVGISHCVDRQRGWCSDFIPDWSDDRAPVAATASGKLREAACVGTGSRTRRLEADFAQSTASAVSQQFDELPLRVNQNSISHMHDLDCNRPGAGFVSLRLSRDAWTTRTAVGARRDSSARLRILALGLWIAGFAGNSGVNGADSIARFAQGGYHN